MELPEFFTAQQARDVANEVSGSEELNAQALDELVNLLHMVIKPIVLRGGSCAWVEFDEMDAAYYVRWKIKQALEVNGFVVTESWDEAVTWRVSWEE